jgi:alpha,alpha-trehalose phosphorylase
VFHIDGVTGPDEYSAIVDDNVYTNLMAERNLRAAAAAVRHRPERAAALGVREEEVEAWLRAADAVVVPFDEALGVHEQSAGFTGHAVWDFEATPPDTYPLLLHYPYFDLYRKQVVKQADLVLAMQTRGDRFTPEQKARNFAYYEAITVRDSSLSAFTQAVMAAEVGCLDLAYAYACEAAFLDLHDLHHNVRDGLHMASLAGAWTALVAGFGGMRDHDGMLVFAPRLPDPVTRLSFTIRHRGHRLRVTTDGHEATYTLFDHDSEIRLRHHGTEYTLRSGEPLTAPVPPAPPAPKVSQPPGREPKLRSR